MFISSFVHCTPPTVHFVMTFFGRNITIKSIRINIPNITISNLELIQPVNIKIPIIIQKILSVSSIQFCPLSFFISITSSANIHLQKLFLSFQLFHNSIMQNQISCKEANPIFFKHRHSIFASGIYSVG